MEAKAEALPAPRRLLPSERAAAGAGEIDHARGGPICVE